MMQKRPPAKNREPLLRLIFSMDHSIPQEAGAAGQGLIVVGGEPLVHDIELHDPPCLARSYRFSVRHRRWRAAISLPSSLSGDSPTLIPFSILLVNAGSVRWGT